MPIGQQNCQFVQKYGSSAVSYYNRWLQGKKQDGRIKCRVCRILKIVTDAA
jgi:hypothetical protein